MLIHVEREKRLAYSARRFSLFINNEFAGEIKNGDGIDLNLPDVPSLLSFKIGNRTMVVASIVPTTEPFNIICWANDSGGIEFYSNSPAITKQTDAGGKQNLWPLVFILIGGILLLLLFRFKLIFFISPHFFLA